MWLPLPGFKVSPGFEASCKPRIASTLTLPRSLAHHWIPKGPHIPPGRKHPQMILLHHYTSSKSMGAATAFQKLIREKKSDLKKNRCLEFFCSCWVRSGPHLILSPDQQPANPLGCRFPHSSSWYQVYDSQCHCFCWLIIPLRSSFSEAGVHHHSEIFGNVYLCGCVWVQR